jgi:hypothetical protein
MAMIRRRGATVVTAGRSIGLIGLVQFPYLFNRTWNAVLASCIWMEAVNNVF